MLKYRLEIYIFYKSSVLNTIYYFCKNCGRKFWRELSYCVSLFCVNVVGQTWFPWGFSQVCNPAWRIKYVPTVRFAENVFAGILNVLQYTNRVDFHWIPYLPIVFALHFNNDGSMNSVLYRAHSNICVKDKLHFGFS